METISSLLRWIAENESVLSGVAATIAIVAVIVALGSNGIRLIRARKQPDSDATDGKIPQEIRYCRTPSGHRIAWSSAGDGYPLVRSLGWFTNLEMEWDSPVSSAFCQKLAEGGFLGGQVGLESGSQRVNDTINKGVDLDNAQSIIENLYKAGVLIHLYTVVGIPGETTEDALMTYRFLKRW